MDEFALCWNNFADNIASGFQNLYDRGDLVDVTIACDGKLLKAHKIVLAICSPYFQEMFMTNPCKHPIIVLKDVSINVMQELLQFMYQGEVNVKHSELQSFMKIAETLQIKGLTASHKNERSSASPAQPAPAHSNSTANRHTLKDLGGPSTSQLDPSKLNSYLAAAAKESLKRAADGSFSAADQYPIHYPKKTIKRSTDSTEQESNSDCMDNLSSDEVFIPTSPQVSMVEQSSSRQFDLTNVKRENANDSMSSPQQSPTNLATSAAAMGAAAAAGMKLGFSSTPTHHPALHPMFGAFDHNNTSFSGIANSLASMSSGGTGNGTGGSPVGKMDYPNDYSQDFGKGMVPGHMDIPAGPSITMLSSTSLLHNNCIFNRNNTVATQQGLKTYWLCKSYRVSMCRARCITHHGQVISSTGVHNHPPHMKGPNEFSQQPPPPPPPPPPPNIGPSIPAPGGLTHHGPQNHHSQDHMNVPSIVNTNGTYDPHERIPPHMLHNSHYQPNSNMHSNPMAPPHHDHLYPSQHQQQQHSYHEMTPNPPQSYSHQHPQQHYAPPPNIQSPMMHQHPPAQQHPPPTNVPPDAPDIKLIQLLPPSINQSDSRTTTVDTPAPSLAGDTATDSMLLPPPPQPPTATSASITEEQLQLKTEQLS